ncbi:MAG: glycosyltransferase [Alphaproteobacteria bacterium]|nr:glycosyltransferase [Alphaproteobacteria bacterium]
MKVAIVHYWLVGMRGGEKVLEALCDLFPAADIFTHVYVPDAVSQKIRDHKIHTTFIGRLPRSSRMYQRYLPLMPLALEQLDLRGYDLILSSESGPAKGIIPSPSALHLCYCHSPMRYIWNMYHDYRCQAGPVTRMLMPLFTHYLRLWDISCAHRVDRFVANSRTTAARLRRYYGRDAAVVPPPVDVDSFDIVNPAERQDYLLMVGELVRYKRPELAVEACNRTGDKLVVIGGGEMLDQLRRIAGPTVTVLGPRPFHELKYHYARCRALLFPGEEDFGIVPVEAMASGRPVIAYARGGATETVVPGLSGVLFPEQSVDAMVNAIRACAATDFDPVKIAAHAAQFSRTCFMERMVHEIRELCASHQAGRQGLNTFLDERGQPAPARDELGVERRVPQLV